MFVPYLVTRVVIADLPRHITESATELSLSVLSELPGAITEGYYLSFTELGLMLVEVGGKIGGALRVDFVEGKLGFRRRQQEAKPDIIKALGIQGGIKPLVWDQTAGLGQDAFVIAQYAGKVRMFERHGVVKALLNDGLKRASDVGEKDDSLKCLVEKMILSEHSCSDVEEIPDVIYLDPMFPARKKSAKVKKGMQIFHHLVGNDVDADMLLLPAIDNARYRVVVKRPLTAPVLAGKAPSFSIKGKTIRFDVYVKAKMPTHLDRTK
ncbi:class I SAM-dependent methyltransferase [Aurantivibrio plasticivorans]